MGYVRDIVTSANISLISILFMFVTLAHLLAYITLWRCVMFVPLEHLEMPITMWCHDMCTTLQHEDIFVTLWWYTYVCYIAMSIYVCQIVIKILCSSNYDVRKCSWDFNVPICSSHCDVTMFGRLQCHYDRHIVTLGNVCQIVTFIYVCHIAMLPCLVDCNVTMIDTLRHLEFFCFVNRFIQLMCSRTTNMFIQGHSNMFIQGHSRRNHFPSSTLSVSQRWQILSCHDVVLVYGKSCRIK